MKKHHPTRRDPLWKAVIVDDEPRSRAIARRMLAAYPAFTVVAECANGYDALAAVSQFLPHLMLLDIQMPEMDGFEVVKKIKPEHLPVVAFLTAFDQYAVRAFEVHALDYLLKPFDEERFASMMQRVEERVTAGDGPLYARKVFTMLETLTAANSYAERFVVRLHGKILVVPVTEVDWIKAEDNYIRIHTGSSSYLERETLTSLCDRLDPRKFVRVHRSVLINVDRIKEVTVINGEYELVLQGGIRIALSRTYRDEFFLRLGDARPLSPNFKKRRPSNEATL
jgi:two-component system LytT family response regulator